MSDGAPGYQFSASNWVATIFAFMMMIFVCGGLICSRVEQEETRREIRATTIRVTDVARFAQKEQRQQIELQNAWLRDHPDPDGGARPFRALRLEQIEDNIDRLQRDVQELQRLVHAGADRP